MKKKNGYSFVVDHNHVMRAELIYRNVVGDHQSYHIGYIDESTITR